MADAHERAAERQAMYPDTRPDSTGRTDQMLVGTTWRRDREGVGDQERAAAAHRSEAQAIYAAYEQACGDRASNEIAVSPIVRYGTGGAPIPGGAVIYLPSSTGSPERLLADIECHRAWMRLAPANMDTCPLDLAGLEVSATATPDGITLTLTVADPKLVPELQRRVAHDLEREGGHSGD
jgi:hypothetical protein